MDTGSAQHEANLTETTSSEPSRSASASGANATKAESTGSPRRLSTPGVYKLRERRARLGISRMEIYCHPDDMPAIKRTLDRLNRARYGTSSP